MPQHYSYPYPLANPPSDNESWYPSPAYSSPYTTTFGSPKGGPNPLLSMMSTSSNTSVAQRTTTWQDKLECECFQLHSNTQQRTLKEELCLHSFTHTFQEPPMALNCNKVSDLNITSCLFPSLDASSSRTCISPTPLGQNTPNDIHSLSLPLSLSPSFQPLPVQTKQRRRADKTYAVHCRQAHKTVPAYSIVSDRRGKRTAWSCTVSVPGGPTASAIYWYDGQYVNGAKEDAAEVAFRIMSGEGRRGSGNMGRVEEWGRRGS